mgnify:CR=1 FL=1
MTHQNSSRNLFIIGAGSLGQLTLDAALEMCKYKTILFIDDGVEKGDRVLGVEVVGGLGYLNKLDKQEHDFIIAISNNKVRKSISKTYDLNYVNIIHPKCSISRFANIKGEGNIILSNTSIDPNVSIESHVIINKNNSIGHDTVLEDFSQVSPGCNIGGFVKLKSMTFLGLGVSVLPQKTIGEETVVGAGAVVTKDLPSKTIAVGVPAKIVE